MIKKFAALFLAFGFVVMSMAPAFARHGDRDNWSRSNSWNRTSTWNQRSGWNNNRNDWNRRQHFNRRTFNNNNSWRNQRKWNNGKHLGWYKNGKAQRHNRNWW